MKIGTRLGLGFAGVIVLLLLLAGLGVNRMAAVIGNTELILHDRYEKVALAHTLENEINRQARALRTALIATDVQIVRGELAKAADADRQLESTIALLRGSRQSSEGQDTLERLLRTRGAYDIHKAKLIELVGAQSLDEGGVYLVQKMMPVQNAYLSAVEAFRHQQTEAMMQFGKEATDVAQHARLVTVGLAAAAIALALAIAVCMTRSITGPISQAVAVAETVAQGDLSSRIEVRRSDETGQLLTTLRGMNDGLASIVRQVRGSSESIASGASQIASGNTDLSRRTEEQASRLQETAAAMEEVTAAAQHNADKAETAARLAMEARAAAVEGGEVVRRVVATVADIASSARKIAEITSVIDRIARQTNILALNAAVEGARAGDGGRGFAVVAAEVRTLAQRAAESARDIGILIGASVDKTDAGARLAHEARGSMEDIVQRVDRVAQLIGEIDAASKEQYVGIGRASEAVGELDQMTQQNAALVDESAAAAESLRGQSVKLAQIVGAFQLGTPDPAVARRLA